MDYSTVKGCVVLKKDTEDGTLSTTKKDLIKSQIELEIKLETD